MIIIKRGDNRYKLQFQRGLRLFIFFALCCQASSPLSQSKDTSRNAMRYLRHGAGYVRYGSPCIPCIKSKKLFSGLGSRDKKRHSGKQGLLAQKKNSGGPSDTPRRIEKCLSVCAVCGVMG